MNIKFQIKKIVSCKWKIENYRRGYTLIELVTVLGVISIMGVLIVSIVYSTLQSAGKAKATNVVAQNGNFALSVITDILLNSQAILDIGGTNVASPNSCWVSAGNPSPSGNTIQVVGLDEGVTTIDCSGNTIASNSASVETRVPVLVTQFASTSLISTQNVTLTSCNFICHQSNPSAPPRVDVAFTLSAHGANPNLAETVATANFSTSVSMRNYDLRGSAW